MALSSVVHADLFQNPPAMTQLMILESADVVCLQEAKLCGEQGKWYLQLCMPNCHICKRSFR